MSINEQLSALSELISNPNTDLETRRAIYEGVRYDTNGFTIYPPEYQRFIDIIRSNGQQASRVKNFSTFIRDHPLIILASAGGITGGIITKYLTTFPIWQGAIAVTGICIAGKIVFNYFSRRHRKVEIRDNPQNSLPAFPIEAVEPIDPQLTPFPTINEEATEEMDDTEDAELQRALALSLEPIQQSEKPNCPFSLEEIPSGQEFEIGNDVFNINYLMSAILSTEPDENESPINPMNRQPLTNEVLKKICDYYHISVNEFLSLYNNPDIPLIIQGEINTEIDELSNELPDDERIQRIGEIQNSESNKKRDLRRIYFIDLIKIYNSSTSDKVQNFLSITK